MKAVIFRALKPAEKKRLQKIRPKLQLVTAPALRFFGRKKKVPKGAFDYTLITSAQTCHFLKMMPKCAAVVFIGDETKRAFVGEKRLSRASRKLIVLKNSHSLGVIDYFRKIRRNKENVRIFFPRSARGDSFLVKKLRSLGCSVVVRHIYSSKLLSLSNLRKQVLGHQSISFLLTSPSIFQAVRRSFPVAYLKKQQIRLIAIGPTTAKEVRRFGLDAKVPKKSSIEGMIKLL